MSPPIRPLLEVPMFRAVRTTLAAASAAGALFAAAPALACEAHQKSEVGSKDARPAATGTASTEAHVLAPVDEVLAATCNCGSASDCTCKKGECRCKKCSKSGVKPAPGGSTRLIEPLKNQPRILEVPQNALHEATGGILI